MTFLSYRSAYANSGHRRLLRLVGAMLLTLLLPSALAAQEEGGAGEAKSALVPKASIQTDSSDGSDRAALFAAHAVASIGSELRAEGLSVSLTTDGPYEAATARRAGFRWLVVSGIVFKSGEATCSIVAFDTERGSIVAAEDFAAWGGPTFVTLIDAAARRVARRIAEARLLLDRARAAPIDASIVFLSPDEGAVITLGEHGANAVKLPALKVRDGRAVSGPLPFPTSSLVEVSVSKTGKLTQRSQYRLIGGQTISLPALRDDRPLGLTAGLGSGRLPGARIGAAFHFPGGWIFMPIDNYIAVPFNFGLGESLVIDEEIWMGLATYLFTPPTSRLRFGLMSKWGLILTIPTATTQLGHIYGDTAVEPIAFFGEYALTPQLAARLEIGSAYAFGLVGSSILETGWMRKGSPTMDLCLEYRP
ncbi:MAG TPA: hypothetical protein VMV44_08935 [Rectinemataceae bacterium]|nr:hypothetical protein [Rectinemataceae bacterium]